MDAPQELVRRGYRGKGVELLRARVHEKVVHRQAVLPDPHLRRDDRQPQALLAVVQRLLRLQPPHVLLQAADARQQRLRVGRFEVGWRVIVAACRVQHPRVTKAWGSGRPYDSAAEREPAPLHQLRSAARGSPLRCPAAAATMHPLPADDSPRKFAEMIDIVRNTITCTRRDPVSPAYRSPPENWEPVRTQLGRKRSRELAALADENGAGSVPAANLYSPLAVRRDEGLDQVLRGTDLLLSGRSHAHHPSGHKEL